MNLLLVGVDLVGLAISAKRAGYRVLAADYFGDYDLQRTCDRCVSVIQQRSGASSGRIEESYDSKAYFRLTESMAEEEHVDAILLSSGLDDEFDTLSELERIAPILGNKPEVIRAVRDREGFFSELNRLGIPHPHTELASDLREAKERARDIGYPVVLKPTVGFAGSGIRFVDSVQSLEDEYTRLEGWNPEGVLIQEYVEGLNASVSFISTSKDARVLTVNEQLIGMEEVYPSEPFGYCGNIVPLDVSESTRAQCEEISARISRRFNLWGSNGVDLVITEDGTPHIIEVNPRFQGTLECVERILGVNLVQLHVQACLKRTLPKEIDESDEYWSRLILFAPWEAVALGLTGLPGVRDIPFPGSIIEEGEPLCSVFSRGDSRETSLNKAKMKADSIYSSIRRSTH